MRAYSWLICSLLMVAASSAQAQRVKVQRGGVPDSGNLRARLILTQDASWRARWQSSPTTLPNFRIDREVALGERLEILTLVSGATPDATGFASVNCDLTVQRPDGSFSANQRDIPCLRRKVSGEAHATYLSTATMKYLSEPRDQKGTWKVKVVVTDRIANTVSIAEDEFVNR